MTENDLNNLSLPAEDARLAAALCSLAQDIQPEPGFQAELEKKLMKTAQESAKKGRQHNTNWIRVLAWSALAAVLLIGLSWVLSNLMPRGYPPAASPEIPLATATPVATEPVGLLLNPTQPPSLPTEALSSTPVSTVYVLSVGPDYDFVLQTNWPASPTEAAVYQQVEPEKLTIENARAVAAKLGLNGEVYKAPYGNPGSLSYLVQDGTRSVTFYNSPASYYYQSTNSFNIPFPNCQPPCLPVESKGMLIDFLNQHGLLDFQATSQSLPSQPTTEQLIQLIDGRPLVYSQPANQGEALFSASGEVMRLDVDPVKVTEVARLPILTAQQAWEQAITSQSINGLNLSTRSIPPTDLRIWNRTHPLDQRVEMFGYVTSYPAAEAGKPPLILFDGYPASGNTQGMADLDPNNPFVQVWGTFQDDRQGGRSLQVDGWQISPFPTQALTGTIQMQGDKAYILTNGRSLLLPDMPADLPQDQPLHISGVVLEQPEPTIEWTSISNQFGGGGGGGGALWADVYLNGATNPLPTAVPTAVPPDLTGQRLDGVQGRPIVFIHQYSDGSTRVEVILNADPNQGHPQEDTFYLEGPGIAGIEAYHNLPIRVWGVISETRGYTQKVNVERVEPVYPGVTVQAWLGKFEKASLEGKDVLLFTNSDGVQYVLNSSIENPGQDNGNAPGDPVVVDGYLLPDKTLGGYPVINDYAVNAAPGMQSLSDYHSMSLKPLIIPEVGKAGSRRIATVTKIELAYYTDEPRYSNREPGMPLPFVQPVWRFTGTYDDGASFELIVQALNPQYLKLP